MGATHTNSLAILLRSKASSIVFIKLIMCATTLCGLTLLAYINGTGAGTPIGPFTGSSSWHICTSIEEASVHTCLRRLSDHH